MSSPTGWYVRSPGLRVRTLPELDACLVYIARPPMLCRLNISAWLILELCDGRALDELQEAYCEAAGNRLDRPGALSQLTEGLGELVELGIVKCVCA